MLLYILHVSLPFSNLLALVFLTIKGTIVWCSYHQIQILTGLLSLFAIIAVLCSCYCVVSNDHLVLKREIHCDFALKQQH